MDMFIKRQNIAHYVEQLKTETDWPRKGLSHAKMEKYVTQMRQHSSVRQRFRNFSVIAMFLIVTVGLCWGLAHI
jgi:hypothetical protein